MRKLTAVTHEGKDIRMKITREEIILKFPEGLKDEGKQAYMDTAEFIAYQYANDEPVARGKFNRNGKLSINLVQCRNTGQKRYRRFSEGKEVK